LFIKKRIIVQINCLELSIPNQRTIELSGFDGAVKHDQISDDFFNLHDDCALSIDFVRGKPIQKELGATAIVFYFLGGSSNNHFVIECVAIIIALVRWLEITTYKILALND
jgi:hypothetical protein